MTSSDDPTSASTTGERAAGSLLTDAQRDELRMQLREEAVRIDEQIAALAASFESIVDAADLVNTDDEHDPEGTTIAFERAQVTALHRQAEEDRDAVAAALERVDDDPSFGRCAKCDGRIGIERLRALPASRFCVQCA